MKVAVCSNQECSKDFPVRHGSTGKFCSTSCSAVVNNRLYPKRSRVPKVCPCGKTITRHGAVKYCSREHGTKYRSEDKVNAWLSGEWDASTANGELSKYIRTYLLSQAEHKCTRCGWKEVNPLLDKPILTVDHIDGDWTNNTVDNLVVLCYNCHTLTPTFNALNKTNPRKRNGRQYNHRRKAD